MNTLIPRIRGNTKVCHLFKDVKNPVERAINLCFKDTKIAGQKHSRLSNHAVERHFNPFTTEKNGAAARNVFVKRENEQRGRTIEGRGVWMVLCLSPSFHEILRDEKNLLWQGVIARLGVVRKKESYLLLVVIPGWH